MTSSMASVFLFFHMLCLMMAFGKSNIRNAFVAPPMQQNTVNEVFNGRGSIQSKWNPFVPTQRFSKGNARLQTVNQLKMSAESSNSNASLEKKELTPDTVVEMIEVTFINACLQLAQG